MLSLLLLFFQTSSSHEATYFLLAQVFCNYGDEDRGWQISNKKPVVGATDLDGLGNFVSRLLE